MRYSDIHKGKIYLRKISKPGGGGRLGRTMITNRMLIVDKKEDTQEVLASILPENGGAATAPQWYPLKQVERWKPNKK